MQMIGTTVSHFRITEKLGEGGMGEVWAAEDVRLGREVALKLLPENFAEDAERHARFEREAKVLASMNHPNIATLFGLEHLDDRHALVMELVEGEGLDERIGRGPLPLDEALSIALQVAEALEAAHENGIVHRDLKPANVMIRSDGTVKVLDFGLAKAWEEQSADGSLSLSPTITSNQSRAGVILGTAAYMSPEQARGKSVDKRADIWAFGVVLFEMLTGRRLFEGEMVTDVLANVLKQEVDWDLLPSETPRSLRHLLGRCLERQPKERIRDIGDVRWHLAEMLRSGGEPDQIVADPETVAPSRRRVAIGWVAGVVIGSLAAVLAWWVLQPAGEAQRTIRSQIVAPEELAFDFRADVGGPVLSPDGSKLVFAARDESGDRSLWIRPLDSLSAQKLGGTEGASFPFWSPDSRWVAFFVTGKLRKIDVSGGPPETVCEAPNGRGGSWSQEGTIVFAPEVFGGLARVASAGGESTSLSHLDPSSEQISERWPIFLPDGKHFLYWAGNPLNSTEVRTDGIYMASIEGGNPEFLMAADTNALYAPPGYLLFLRSQTLMAQAFDAERRELRGQAFPIAENIANPQNYRLGDFSVSQRGELVYQTGQTGLTQAAWYNQKGRTAEAVGEPDAIDGFRPSPDRRLLAEQVSDNRSKNVDLWIVDIGRNVRTRFTFEPGLELSPVWSPSGDRIAYSANPEGHLDVFVKNANGAGQAEPLFESDATKYVSDWSPDGRYLAVTNIDPKGTTIADIWIVPVSGDEPPQPFIETPFVESGPVFSPDGQWLAYQSNESGRVEIYLTPFPGPGGKWQVSQNGGSEPHWRSDGGALYYRSPDSKLFVADVDAAGNAVEVGAPRQLIELPPDTGSGSAWSYAVFSETDRFLVLQPIQSTTVPLTLVTNWAAEFER
jgi:Tol biopolymer transport system component